MTAEATPAGALPPSGWDFNKELLCGEVGALLVANVVATLAAHCTGNAAWISAAAVAGTLSGGSLFWLAVRIFDRTRTRPFAAKAMASDLSYFTPAAIGIGWALYQPALFATSHYLLRRGIAVGWAVTSGQAVGFGLFLAAMNAYRLCLLKINGKRL